MPLGIRIVAAGLAFVLALGLSSGMALAAAKAAPAGKVNINSASAQQLSELPGVGDKLAARIVEYRQKSGGFKTVQELMNVKGVGEKNFAKIAGLPDGGRGGGEGRPRAERSGAASRTPPPPLFSAIRDPRPDATTADKPPATRWWRCSWWRP